MNRGGARQNLGPSLFTLAVLNFFSKDGQRCSYWSDSRKASRTDGRRQYRHYKDPSEY